MNNETTNKTATTTTTMHEGLTTWEGQISLDKLAKMLPTLNGKKDYFTISKIDARIYFHTEMSDKDVVAAWERNYFEPFEALQKFADDHHWHFTMTDSEQFLYLEQ